MNKREAKFNTLYNSWARNIYKRTHAYELKQTIRSSIAYSLLEKHQEDWLLTVKTNVAVFKIPDLGNINPFDGFCLANAPAFVVVLFQKTKVFYLIDIENWIHYRDRKAKRKSLTEGEADSICHLRVEL